MEEYQLHLAGHADRSRAARDACLAPSEDGEWGLLLRWENPIDCEMERKINPDSEVELMFARVMGAFLSEPSFFPSATVGQLQLRQDSISTIEPISEKSNNQSRMCSTSGSGLSCIWSCEDWTSEKKAKKRGKKPLEEPNQAGDLEHGQV